MQSSIRLVAVEFYGVDGILHVDVWPAMAGNLVPLQDVSIMTSTGC